MMSGGFVCWFGCGFFYFGVFVPADTSVLLHIPVYLCVYQPLWYQHYVKLCADNRVFPSLPKKSPLPSSVYHILLNCRRCMTPQSIDTQVRYVRVFWLK